MSIGRQLWRWGALTGFVTLAAFAALLVVRSAERFYYAFAVNVETDDLTMRHLVVSRELSALGLAVGSSILAYLLLRFALASSPGREHHVS
jgi:hypothetical protein